MSYSQNKGQIITNYKDLITFQLMNICKASANIMSVDETAITRGANPADIFMLAVRSLDDCVVYIWDDDYKKKRAEILKAPWDVNHAHVLFQEAVSLICRRELLAITKSRGI